MFFNMLTQWIYKSLESELLSDSHTERNQEPQQVQILDHSPSLDSFLLSDGLHFIMACLDNDYATLMKATWEKDWALLKFGLIRLVKYHFFRTNIFNGINQSMNVECL